MGGRGCWRVKGTNLPAGKKTSSVCIVSGGIYSSRCSHKEMTSVWNLKAVILLKAPMVRLCVESCGLLFFFCFYAVCCGFKPFRCRGTWLLTRTFDTIDFSAPAEAPLVKKERKKNKERKEKKRKKILQKEAVHRCKVPESLNES